MTQNGGSVKKRDLKTISIRLDPEIREIIEREAKKDRRSVASLIELATLSYLRERGLLPE